MSKLPAHNRMRPKAGTKATPAERQHMEWVAAMPCLVSGEQATVHHVTASAHVMGRLTRSHQLVVPLAPRFHQKVADPKASDPISVEGLGHRGFFKRHGIDLLAEAKVFRRESIEMGIL